MASKRMIRREQKRLRLQRLRPKRQKLVKELKDPTVGLSRKQEIQEELEKMPRDSSSSRLSNRCRRNGRAHAVYRRFGVCRNELRRLAMNGEVPGLVMASW